MSGLSKSQCSYMIVMLDVGLIDYRFTQPWADKMLFQVDPPPIWLCDVAIEKDQEKQIKAFASYIFDEPFEEFPTDLDQFQIACYWIFYARGDWSLARFLRESAEFLDSTNSEWVCEVPYHLLWIHEEDYPEFTEEEIKEKYLEQQDVRPWVEKVQNMLAELFPTHLDSE